MGILMVTNKGVITRVQIKSINCLFFVKKRKPNTYFKIFLPTQIREMEDGNSINHLQCYSLFSYTKERE